MNWVFPNPCNFYCSFKPKQAFFCSFFSGLHFDRFPVFSFWFSFLWRAWLSSENWYSQFFLSIAVLPLVLADCFTFLAHKVTVSSWIPHLHSSVFSLWPFFIQTCFSSPQTFSGQSKITVLFLFVAEFSVSTKSQNHADSHSRRVRWSSVLLWSWTLSRFMDYLDWRIPSSHSDWLWLIYARRAIVSHVSFLPI